MLICVCSLLNSTTLHIKQDGTGNFTTIQEGINASADSDTVLVYPGTFFESINYNNKNITVASLYLNTGNEQYISQTIIDGNNETRCVLIEECEDIALIGFTIQNGYAIGGSTSGWGGGLLIMDVENGLLSNCQFTSNTATSGGAIIVYATNLILKSNTISYNRGISQGGGLIILDTDTTVEFDPIELNNIYLNYASTGSDIYISSNEFYEVVLDTFTVAEFENFFIAPHQCEANLSVQNYVVEQIDQDLYVSPDGSDENSGLTTDEPLQTIAWAQTLIKRNDDNPHTIHLAPGTYSPSLNNQKFPIGIKQGITYLGSTPENTILDGEHQFTIIEYTCVINNLLPNLIVRNMKFINATDYDENYGAIYCLKTDIELENVTIENCYGDFASALLCRDGIYNFNNVQILDNNGGFAVLISCIPTTENPEPIMTVHMVNSLIKNNNPGQGEMAGSGGGLQLGGHLTIPDDYYVSLVNCDISSNYSNYNSAGVAGTTGLYANNNITADIINCTFGDNTVTDTTGCVITGATQTQVNIYNSILYGNVGHSCNLWFETEINVYNSLLEGGSDNVGFYYPVNASFNWHEGNLDEDPLWVNSGEYPYMFQSTSPCIDAGTLDLPAGIELPEFDLAGNPRIYGETIDMGAYEWQGVEAEEDNILLITQTKISNYPNPFNPSTTIKLNLVESGKIELAIYNIKGQKVKTLMDAYSTKGYFEMIWKGVDNNKKKVASGNYFIKLKVNEEEKAVSKCILLK